MRIKKILKLKRKKKAIKQITIRKEENKKRLENN